MTETSDLTAALQRLTTNLHGGLECAERFVERLEEAGHGFLDTVDRLEGVVRAFEQRLVSLVATPTLGDAVAAAVTEPGPRVAPAVVLHLSAQPTPDEAERISKWSQDAGVRVLLLPPGARVAATIGDVVVIDPLVAGGGSLGTVEADLARKPPLTAADYKASGSIPEREVYAYQGKVSEVRLGWWYGLGPHGSKTTFHEAKAHAAILGEALGYYLCGERHEKRDERFTSREPTAAERCPGCADRVELKPSGRIPRERVEWVLLTTGDTSVGQFHAFDKQGLPRPAPCGQVRHSTGHVEASPKVGQACRRCFVNIDYPDSYFLAEGAA